MHSHLSLQPLYLPLSCLQAHVQVRTISTQTAPTSLIVAEHDALRFDDVVVLGATQHVTVTALAWAYNNEHKAKT